MSATTSSTSTSPAAGSSLAVNPASGAGRRPLPTGSDQYTTVSASSGRRGPSDNAANHVVSRAGYRSTTTSAVDRSTAASTSASGVPAEADTDIRSIETPNRLAASTD